MQLVCGRFAPITYNDELNVASEGSTAEAEFARNQLSSIITQTNGTIFIFAAVFAVLFVATILFRRKKLGFLAILPGIFLSAYIVFYIALYAYGIPFFHGGWYRTFWAVPVVFGLLVAWLGGESRKVIVDRFTEIFAKQPVVLTGHLILVQL